MKIVLHSIFILVVLYLSACEDSMKTKCITHFIWDESTHNTLLHYLEREHISINELICDFGIDIMSLNTFLSNFKEEIKTEIRDLKLNRCKQMSCPYDLIEKNQQMLKEITYMEEVIEQLLLNEIYNRFKDNKIPLYDIQEVMTNSYINALERVINEITYTQLKYKIDSDDLYDIPEVRLLLEKIRII